MQSAAPETRAPWAGVQAEDLSEGVQKSSQGFRVSRLDRADCMKLCTDNPYVTTLSCMAVHDRGQLPIVFTHADARALGVSDRDLYQMRDHGHITRIARGIYTQPDLAADFDLIEIAVRAPRATLCLTSALAHHDLTGDIPPVINVAIPRGTRSPRTTAPAKWHHFDPATFTNGRDTIAITDDISIGIYSPTRSIIDAYRLRHLYGTDQAHTALKHWLRHNNQPSELLTQAKHFPRAEPIIRSTLEILL